LKTPYRRGQVGSKNRFSKNLDDDYQEDGMNDGFGDIPRVDRSRVSNIRSRSSVATNRKVDRYDFTKSEKLGLEQERYFEKILIHFAELVSALLISHLHLRVQVKWENIDYVSYEVYTHSLVEPSALNIFSIEDFNVRGIFFTEFPMCLSIVDRILGGKGQSVSEENRLTEIEEVVFFRIVQKLLLQFVESFKEIKEISIKPEKMEFNPQAVQIYSPSEPMVISNFRIRVGDMPGDIKLCLPLRFLKPIIPKVKASDLLPKSTVNMASKIAPSPFLIESARIGIVVELGKSELMFQDLVNIGVGDVVRLDTLIENPLRIKIEHKTKFLGRPGVKDKKVSIQICKVVQEGDEEFNE